MRLVLSRCVLGSAVGLGLALYGCGGGGGTSTPTTPTQATRVIGLTGTLSFGDVAVGQALALPLTVTNTGNDTITIRGFSLSLSTGPSAFSIAVPGNTIPAGGSLQVAVTFKPTAVGVHSGTLTIDGNQTGGTDRCAVTGTGVAAASVAAR